MQSIIYSFLSLRVLYTFLLLAYVIYIYDFTENEYESYFKLFFVLAILNSALSIIQFSIAGQLGFSNQLAGGIFGYHGTGISAIFSVVQSALCIQIFLKKRKIIYFFLSIFIAIPIVTGYAYGGFAFLGIASIISLIFKVKFLPLISKSLAPIGCIFSLISIATGALWGKPTWGVWWVWDARLTSMLILFIFYLAYICTWKFMDDYEKANKASSLIAIIGLFNLPIIKYSVDWWSTLHQPASITLTSAPTIHYTMLIPLLVMFLGMTIYSIVVFLIRYKIEILKFKINKKKD